MVSNTILNPNVDKYARGFFVVPRRSPAGLLVASQGDSTQAQRKRHRRIVYSWVENSISHLLLAKTLTARQAACVFCKHHLAKIHLVGLRDSF